MTSVPTNDAEILKIFDTFPYASLILHIFMTLQHHRRFLIIWRGRFHGRFIYRC